MELRGAWQVDAWLDGVERSGPLYLSILKALEVAIRDGVLQPGDRLPPQREVAARLGIDFTTVTRAYGLARERGLVEGTVGRGTFVKGRSADDEAGLVDLGMNLPPPPQGLSLAALLTETTRDILARTDAGMLMAYHPGAGSPAQKAAGAAWLAPTLGAVAPERILVAAGAQAALAALLGLLCRPGETVVVDPVTYPGFIGLAGQMGLDLVACPADGEGMVPEALARLCAERRPAAVYTMPTQHNPGAWTMGPDRRRDLAAAVERAGVCLIEDDAYGRLPASPLPALASLTPAWHVATLAKHLTPGLRTAFVVAPDGAAAAGAERALRAVSLMPAPLMAAVAARWIRDGTAEQVLAAVRAEAVQRRAIAAEILPAARGGAESLHVWLDLPPGWDGRRLREAARERGLSLVTADSFAVGEARDGMRISLGGPSRQAVLRQALAGVAAILAGGPGQGRAVV
jgi:DNA-binding transcriptional MocR family regulator